MVYYNTYYIINIILYLLYCSYIYIICILHIYISDYTSYHMCVYICILIPYTFVYDYISYHMHIYICCIYHDTHVYIYTISPYTHDTHTH